MNAWNIMSVLLLYVHMSMAYSALKKKDFLLAPDTIYSCIEAVNELFQDTSGYDCIEHDVNTIAVCLCMTTVYSILKKGDFHYFSCKYHMQLHWRCWRAVPAHLGSWMNGSLCQYYWCMWIYVYCPFCFKKWKIFTIVAADTICSCIEAVDEQFQHILGSECI